MTTAESTRLLSRSCTTGWFDWVWGELWLTPEGIVRLSLGWDETRRVARERRSHKGGSTVADDSADAPFTATEKLRERFVEDPKNRRIPFAEVRSARLRRGVLNGRLRVKLTDGTRMKLLWLKDDPAYHVLAEVLRARLGADLTLR